MNTSYLDIVVAKIKEKNTEVVSFDFFDTLMSRRVPFPRDIFWILGEELTKRNLLGFNVTPERFQALRIRAEQKARDLSTAKEIDIDSIYHQFPADFFNVDIEAIIQLEVDIEKRFLFASQDMINIIKLAHKRGKKIIVVSDIYLYSEHLKYFWGDSTPGIDITFFASSEHKVGKYDKLFDIVLHKLKIKPHAVVHTGDNYISDVEVPSKKGIKTCFVPHGSSLFWKTFDSEVTPAQHFNERICSENGDLGITALRCKAMLHRGSDNIDSNTFFRYGAQILGPVFSPFIHWVNSVVMEEKIDVVLPLMREGYMIDKLLSSYPEVTSRPAYLSRRVLFQAGLSRADQQMLEGLRFGNLKSSVSDYLELIGLYPSDANDLRDVRTKCISDDAVFNELIKIIVGSAALMHLIRSRAMEVRSGILAHLKSLISGNGEFPKCIALVDVGWNATIQRLLQVLLDEERIDTKVVGLYMMTTPSVNDLLFDGILAKGYYVDGGYPSNDFITLSRTLEIFEQSCAPAHGSVLRHDLKSGKAILKPDLIPGFQRGDIEDIQEGIFLFNDIYRAHVATSTSAEVLSKMAKKYRPILRRAMLAPTDQEAQLFSAWQHDDNLASGSVMPIMGSESVRTFMKYKTMRQFLDTPMNELYWPAAALALQDPARARYLSAAAMNSLDPSIYDTDLMMSSELAAKSISSNAGTNNDFDIKDHQHVYANASGKTYLRFQIQHKEDIMLRWTPLAKAFDLKIDFIAFTHTPTDGLSTYHRTEGDRFQSDCAVCIGMEQYDSAAWRGKSTGSAFYFKDLQRHGISPTGTLIVEIGCEIKPIEACSVAHSQNDSIELSTQTMLRPAHTFIELFNDRVPDKGQQILKSLDGLVNLSGWMIDSEFQKTDGSFFMRLTNPIGHAQFIQMNSILRPDVATQIKKDNISSIQEDLGFSIVNYRINPGTYMATIIRKGLNSIHIGKESWQIIVEPKLQ